MSERSGVIGIIVIVIIIIINVIIIIHYHYHHIICETSGVSKYLKWRMRRNGARNQ